MTKKTSSTVAVLALLLLLTASSAFAGPTGSAAVLDTSFGVSTWVPRVGLWLQGLVAWIDQTLEDKALKEAAAPRESSRLDRKPGKPAPSDPGVILIPMDGADGDPNG